MFAGLASVGLFVRTPVFALTPFDDLLEGLFSSLPGFSFYLDLPINPAFAFLAFVAGLLFPKGFWLWGAAIFLLTPFAAAALTWRLEARGLSSLEDESISAVGYGAFLMMLAVGQATLTTPFSALGAALRVLPRAFGMLRSLRAGRPYG